jgi:hypothetical protein
VGTSTSKKRSTASVDKRVTWAQTARDVTIAAMDKGQLLPLGLLAIVLLMVFRMDPSDDAALANRLLDLIKHYAAVGYLGWVVTMGGWYLHAKTMRIQHNEESGRIGREKSRLQERISGEHLPSSRR